MGKPQDLIASLPHLPIHPPTIYQGNPPVVPKGHLWELPRAGRAVGGGRAAGVANPPAGEDF